MHQCTSSTTRKERKKQRTNIQNKKDTRTHTHHTRVQIQVRSFEPLTDEEEEEDEKINEPFDIRFSLIVERDSTEESIQFSPSDTEVGH